jgi:mycothiol synthase
MRALRESELPVALRILREDEEDLFGRPSRIEASDLHEWLSQSDLETDSWAIEDGDGLAAFGWSTPWGDFFAAIGVVAPRAKGRGLGAQLLERSEAHARERGAPRIQQIVLGADPAAAELMIACGYREVRRFYEMAIELERAPEVAGAVPIETLRDEDARAFHDALEEAFQDHWGHQPQEFESWWERRRSSPGFDPSLWFLVREDGDVVAAIRNEANRNGGGYVGALGVRRAHRGRGLARTLLLHSFGEFQRRGLSRVTLGVDAESPTGATRLYESVGMEVEMENVIYEKELT